MHLTRYAYKLLALICVTGIALSGCEKKGKNAASVKLSKKPALITISDSGTFDFGVYPTGSSVDKTYTVTYSDGGISASSMTAYGLSGPLSFKGGSYPGTDGTCSVGMGSGSCTIVVNFAPTSTGDFTQNMVFSYYDGGNTQLIYRTIHGGTQVALSIADGSTYSYSTQARGSSTDHSFTISFSGGQPATGVSVSGLSAPINFKGGTFPGTGGTCAASISTDCTIIVTYAPTANGSSSKTMLISYSDGYNAQSTSTVISGTAADPAVLSISDGATYSYGTKARGSSTDKTFTVTYTGGVPAASITGGGISAPYTYKGSSYPGTGGTCGTSISSGTCTIVVTFAPTANGTHNSTISLSYSDGAATQAATRAVTAVAADPAALSISDGATYAYGTLARGSSNDKTFTVTFTGGVPATSISASGLSAPITFKGGTYPGTGGTCSTTLSSGSCTVVVTYAPSANGSTSQTLTLSYNDGAADQTATRAITATAADPASLSISDGATYAYGTLARGSSNDKTFTVTFSGGVPATSISASGLSAPITFKGGTYPGTGGTCGATISSGTCTVVVTYAPTANGATSQTLTLSYNDGAANQTATRAITATAADPAVLSISDGATYAYGTLARGSSNDKTFTVTYTGGVAATSMSGSGLSAPYTFKGGTYPGTGGTCSTSISSSTCTIVVNYSPTSNATNNATLTLSYHNGVSTQSATRAITATAADPASLSISDGATYDYGTKATGSSTDKTFTVTNSGTITATSVSASGLSAPLTYKGGTYPGTGGTCSASIAAGTCTIIVTFAPSSTGTTNSTLTLAYYDGANNQSATRDMTAIAATPASLSISDGATYAYGTLARGSSNDKTFTVTFSGGVPATSISASGLSAPITFKGGTYPGTGGTCSTTLSSGTCTVVVTYAPTANGSTSQTLTLSYNDGAANQTATRAITATAADPAVLSISDGATYAYGTLARGSSNDKTFTVTYTGGVAATSMSGSGLSAPYTFKGGTYPGTGGTCSTSISSSTCTIVVNYSPTSNATNNATLTLSYHNGVSTQSATRAITATAADPASLSISDGATYDYGTKATGSSTDKTFTVTNSGTITATSVSASGLSAPLTYKGGTYPGTGGTCSASIAAGTCTIIVTFAPSSTGTTNSTLTLAYYDGANNQSATRDMTAIAATPASLSISDGATYAYGTLARGSSNDKTFTVTFSGGVPATSISASGLSAPITFKGGTYPGTGGTCSTTLSSGTCTVVVTYAPTANGSTSQTLTLSYNDGAANQTATRAITATAADPAVLSISDGATYAYGTLARGSSNDKTFTVTYTGGVTATSISASGLSAPITFKGGTYPGTGGTCSTSLSSGTCTVVVTYAPTANGSTSQTLTLSYNDGAADQTATRAITATAANPAALSISDGATYDFGSLARGSTTDKTFTVTNGGGVAATSISSSGLSAPITFKGGTYPGTGGTCSTSLSPGTCTVVVNYLPTVNGATSQTMQLDYNDGAASQSVTRDITATAVDPGVLTISDAATYDYGTLARGSSTDKSFTVTFSGTYATSSLSGSGLSAPLTFKGGTYPGTGGTCSTTLSSGTCTVVVTYAPTANGSSSQTLQISYNDGVATRTATRAITATAVDPASLSISDGTTYSFGTKARGTSTDKTFTVTYAGGVTATSMAGSGLSAPYTFKGGTYPGTGGTCSISISSGTCTIIVTWAPTANGTQTATLSLAYNDGAANQTATRAMTAVGADPASLSISDGTTYDYGTKARGSSTDKTFTITNGGGVSATSVTDSGLSAPFTFKGGTYPGTGGTCSATIAVGTCTVVVTYAPTANGNLSVTLQLDYSDTVNSQSTTRAMTGTAVDPASLSISDGATYDYGSVARGSTNDKTFTITNGGGVSATSMSGSGLSAPYTFNGGTYPGTGGTCSTSLSASGTCTIVVRYAPTSNGNTTATVTISYNDGVTSQSATRDMTGTAVDPGVLTISDATTYSYGTKARGSSTDKTFTVTYSGSAPVTSISGSGLSAPYTFKGGTYPGTGGTCTGTLSSGTCTIVVTWAPTANGTQTATITLSYNDGAASQTATRGLTGVGADPASLSISDGTTYSYGTKARGSTTDKTFTVTNSGGVAASSVSGAALSGAYDYKGAAYPGTGGTCSTSLAVSGTCTIVVTFSPTSNGTLTSTLQVNYNDGAASQSTTRGVTGVGADPASLSISDGATYDFGSLARGSSTDKTFTITNGGGVAATSIAGSGLSAPLTFKGGSYPGTGGTCTSSLSPGTCTLVVNYSPTVNGA